MCVMVWLYGYAGMHDLYTILFYETWVACMSSKLILMLDVVNLWSSWCHIIWMWVSEFKWGLKHEFWVPQVMDLIW